MKTIYTILIFNCCLFFASAVCYSQIDSTAIQTVLQTGVTIATATNNTIIPKVPNEITSSLITIIAGIIIRYFEKRRLKKKGKLNE